MFQTLVLLTTDVPAQKASGANQVVIAQHRTAIAQPRSSLANSAQNRTKSNRIEHARREVPLKNLKKAEQT